MSEEEVRPAKLFAVNGRLLARFVECLRNRKRKTAAGKEPRYGLARMTIKNYLVALKTALAWAVGQGMMARVLKFPKIKVPKKRPVPVPGETYERLLDAETDPLWQAFMQCGWLAGLRLSEASDLRRNSPDSHPWVDFGADRGAGRIVLPAKFVKSGEDQWVPLHPALREILATIPDTGDKFFDFRTMAGKPMPRSTITAHVVWPQPSEQASSCRCTGSGRDSAARSRRHLGREMRRYFTD